MNREVFEAVCSDCGQKCEVPFKPAEGRPVRCIDCFRKGWHASRNKGNFRGLRNFGARSRRDFNVSCAECGKQTTVPFKPTQGRPVLCRDCFKKT